MWLRAKLGEAFGCWHRHGWWCTVRTSPRSVAAMSEGHKPALSIGERVRRVAAFLFGTGVTAFAVLTMAGIVVWNDGAGEPVHNIFVRIVLGLVYGFWGLATIGGAIYGFAEVSDSHKPRTRRVSSGRGIDGDIDVD